LAEIAADEHELRLAVGSRHAHNRAIHPVIADEPWIHIPRTWQAAIYGAVRHTLQHSHDEPSIFDLALTRQFVHALINQLYRKP
jgi:hypothetical protein